MHLPAAPPLVGLPADTFLRGPHVFHGVGDKYVRSVAVAAEAVPVMIPSLGSLMRLPQLLARFDGIVMTGSISNVHPTEYGAKPDPRAEPHDEARDATTLDLIRLTLDMAIPLFVICRGIQELNVALGGTLQSEVQEISGKLDHREIKHDDMDTRYAARHKAMLAPGGVLQGILGVPEIEVNSLHRQAIGRLAPNLQVEATATDGTIEAVSVRGARAFALGVQWHPEYKVMDNPDSVKIFAAFGDAVRDLCVAKGRRKTEPRAGRHRLGHGLDDTDQFGKLVQAVEQRIRFAGHNIVRQAEAVDPGHLIAEIGSPPVRPRCWPRQNRFPRLAPHRYGRRPSGRPSDRVCRCRHPRSRSHRRAPSLDRRRSLRFRAFSANRSTGSPS